MLGTAEFEHRTRIMLVKNLKKRIKHDGGLKHHFEYCAFDIHSLFDIQDLTTAQSLPNKLTGIRRHLASMTNRLTEKFQEDKDRAKNKSELEAIEKVEERQKELLLPLVIAEFVKVQTNATNKNESLLLAHKMSRQAYMAIATSNIPESALNNPAAFLSILCRQFAIALSCDAVRHPDLKNSALNKTILPAKQKLVDDIRAKEAAPVQLPS